MNDNWNAWITIDKNFTYISFSYARCYFAKLIISNEIYIIGELFNHTIQIIKTIYYIYNFILFNVKEFLNICKSYKDMYVNMTPESVCVLELTYSSYIQSDNADRERNALGFLSDFLSVAKCIGTRPVIILSARNIYGIGGLSASPLYYEQEMHAIYERHDTMTSHIYIHLKSSKKTTFIIKFKKFSFFFRNVKINNKIFKLII